MGTEISEFGALLKKLRDEANLSQPQLAERASLSKGYIGGIEAGLRGQRPSRDTIIAIARALEVPPLRLLVAAGRDVPADHGKVHLPRPTFQEFVKGEHLLREAEKRMLVTLYESYVGQR